ncbi:MAG: hypothetical protein IT464_10460 [Planctomycetes bacterium]|nr:hypothetical protein [Planctomycetota bacterium]
MTVPSEIRQLLGSVAIQAHASLACSLDGPIGETHLVVADGQMFVFTRESMFGDFTRVALDAAHPPYLEPGDFNDTLHIALANGTAHELNVSTFERDSVAAVIAGGAERVASEPTPPEKPAPAPAAPAQVPALPDPEHHEGASKDLTHGKQKSFSQPEPEPKPPDPPPAAPAETVVAATGKEAADEQRGVFYGNDVGCAGCLLQLAVFFGAIGALWLLHIQAMAQLGSIFGTVFADDDATYVVTKIAVVICGMWAGFKGAVWIEHLFKARDMTGMVLIGADTAKFIGRRRAFVVSFDLRRPIRYSVEAFSKTPPNDEAGKLQKRQWTVLVRLEQGEESAALRVTQHCFESQLSWCGQRPEIVAREPEHRHAVNAQEQTARRALIRLRKA